MKKRYLAMLMAVVMCVALFVTGAMAAEETVGEQTPVETAEASESAAPVSEQPEQSAAPEETAVSSVQSADVPQPVAIAPSDGEGATTALSDQSTKITAGTSGTVTFDIPDPQSSEQPTFAWQSTQPNDVEYGRPYDSGNGRYKLELTVGTGCAAGSYPFTISYGSNIYSGTLVVDAAPSPSPVTLSFPISQTVTVKNTGAQAKDKEFKYCVVAEHWDPDMVVSLGDSTTGGTWTLTKESTEAAGDHKLTVYELALTMTADDTATANISITTTEPVAMYVFQVSKGDDWEYGRGMFEAVIGLSTTDTPFYTDPVTGTTMHLWSNDPLDESKIPTTGDFKYGYQNLDNSASEDEFYGYDGKWYNLESTKSQSSVSFTNTYTGPAWEYAKLDLYAWTMKNVTWDKDTKSYGYDAQMLSNIDFELYMVKALETGGTKEDVLASATTDENGKATIDSSKLNPLYLPALEEDDTTGSNWYYLRQASGYTVNGKTSPVDELYWPVEVKAELSVDGSKVTVTLTPQGNDWGEMVMDGQQQGFWVRNERYTSMSFDITKTVAVKNKGVQTGENTFNFLVALDTSDDVQLDFTPAGGEKTQPAFTQKDDSEVRLYTLPLTVNGAGTAKGTVTISGWESELMRCYIEVYELGDAPADWEYADDMYSVTRPGYDYTDDNGGEAWQELLYDGMEMVPYHWTEIVAPAGGEDTLPGGVLFIGEEEFLYRGHDGKWYDTVFDDFDGVTFVNTYTKALPAATTAKKNSPKTGDEANLVLWLALATVSTMSIAVVDKKKKSK